MIEYNIHDLHDNLFQKNWPGTAISFAHFVYKRLKEMAEVIIDENTCMAQDNANKVGDHKNLT